MGRGGPLVAPGSTGILPESTAGRLQGINAGMLEGILKLVASQTTSSASQPLVPQQQQPIQQTQQQSSQRPIQQSQPSYECQNVYGSTYPSQNVYIQPANQHGYVSSGIPRGGMIYGQQHDEFQCSAYDNVQPAARLNQDVNPVFIGQLTSPLVDRNVDQMPSQPVTDHAQRLAEMMGQAGSRNQPSFSFRPVGGGMDTQLMTSSASQPHVPEQQLTQQPQPNVVANVPPQAQPPQAAMPNPYPFSATPAVKQPEKVDAGQQKSEVDKETLSRLLSMISGGGSVTTLMQKLMNKDETKKQESPAPEIQALETLKRETPAREISVPQTPKKEIPVQETTAQPERSSVPAVVPARPQTTESDIAKPTVTAASQIPPEPVIKLHSAFPHEQLMPILQLDPTALELEAKAAEIKSTMPALSSLSQLYDSPDESKKKDSGPTSKTGDKRSSSASSKMIKYDEWECNTEEFLRQLQSKSAAPAQPQKEKSRSKSRDKTAKRSKTDAKKRSDKRDVRNEVSRARIESEKDELMRGKSEIEGALELLQKELANLRAGKKRLLESPAGLQRNKELEDGIVNERKLTDHMSHLKSAMAELNAHFEKLSSRKV